MEQLVARRAHNPKVVGSSPTPATTALFFRGLFYFWGETMPFYTYVLISDEGYHYTGSTENLQLRVERHRLKTTHFTKRGTNWRIVFKKEFMTRSEAMKFEKWLKSGRGRSWLKENVPGWSPPKAE